MARADMNSLAERDVTPLPSRQPAAAATPAEPTAPTASAKRHGRPGERTGPVAGGEPEEALGVDVPVSMKRELKATSANHGEKMKHVVARAIRRELDRMKETE